MEEDREVMRLYGLRVPDSQLEQLIKTINSIPACKQKLQRIRQSLKSQPSQDDFLQQLITKTKSSCPSTSPTPKLLLHNGTYHIQAINPLQIPSLTQRAFFSSFTLHRNSPIQHPPAPAPAPLTPPPTTILPTSSTQKPTAPEQQYTQVLKYTTTIQIEEGIELKNNIIIKTIADEKTESSCFCGKELEDSWVSCDNENCKGTKWYHYSCVGLTDKDEVEKKPFICGFCRGETMGDEFPLSKRRRQ